jgi:hypothetical protein
MSISSGVRSYEIQTSDFMRLLNLSINFQENVRAINQNKFNYTFASIYSPEHQGAS